MVRNVPLTPRRRRFARFMNPVTILIFSSIGALIWAYGCQEMAPSTPSLRFWSDETSAGGTGEGFLLSALEEIDRIAEFSLRSQSVRVPHGDELAGVLPGVSGKKLVEAAAADTTYMYGEITADGYGAVVTERHTYPKGIPLITVRRSYGKPSSHVVTETKRYISYADFLNDAAEQSNVTEVYGLSSDTIVTHVLRNGLLETYTFRLPVVTRVISPADASVRVTRRYGDSGAVVSEIRDGAGLLQLLRRTSGAPDGAILSYTLYPDSSWRNSRTIGQADGSVVHEITSGP